MRDYFEKQLKTRKEEKPSSFETEVFSVNYSHNLPWDYNSEREVSGTAAVQADIIGATKSEVMEALEEYVDQAPKKEVNFSDGVISKKNVLNRDMEYLSNDNITIPLPRVEAKLIFILESSQDESKNDEIQGLLQKMIGAMKLPEHYSYQVIVSRENFKKNELYNLVMNSNIRAIVSFGAFMTNEILNSKERLSNIHGQFFRRNLITQNDEDVEIDVIPLFHPEYLLMNPSMKKTTWLDMQKIMAFIDS